MKFIRKKINFRLDNDDIKSGGRTNTVKIKENFNQRFSYPDYSGSRDSQNESGFRSRSDSDVDIFSGTYHFDKYDENLEEYLDSLGLSGDELGRIVRDAKIRIVLRKPIYPDTKWTLTTIETGTFLNYDNISDYKAKKRIKVLHRIQKSNLN